MCRNCPKQIEQLPIGTWVDGQGFANCCKDVPHVPMPPDLAGVS